MTKYCGGCFVRWIWWQVGWIRNSGQCLQHFRAIGLRETGLISEEVFRLSGAATRFVDGRVCERSTRSSPEIFFAGDQVSQETKCLLPVIMIAHMEPFRDRPIGATQ